MTASIANLRNAFATIQNEGHATPLVARFETLNRTELEDDVYTEEFTHIGNYVTVEWELEDGIIIGFDEAIYYLAGEELEAFSEAIKDGKLYFEHTQEIPAGANLKEIQDEVDAKIEDMVSAWTEYLFGDIELEESPSSSYEIMDIEGEYEEYEY